MDSLLDELREKYCVSLKKTSLHGLGSPSDVRQLYSSVLRANLCDITEPRGLPGCLGSQISPQSSFTLKASILLQICAARDATQPLRPCADTSEAEAFHLGSPGQTHSNPRRLLKLLLTNGHVELTAVELETQNSLFKGVPTPGEKVLVKEGSEVKNGLLIISPTTMVSLGGGVDSLKREFEYQQKHRNGSTLASRGSDAPTFEPFVPGSRVPRASLPLVTGVTSDALPFSTSAANVRENQRKTQGAGRGSQNGPHGYNRSGRGRAGNHAASRGSRGAGNTGTSGNFRESVQRVPVFEARRSEAVPFPTNSITAWGDDEDFPVLGDY